MLEMDAVSRTHGVGLAEIESQLAAYKATAQPQVNNPVADFDPVASKELVDLENAQPVNTGPNYIDNPDQYRMKYDPSARGQANQSQVNQAIICPCSAPLIPVPLRPILRYHALRLVCPRLGSFSSPFGFGPMFADLYIQTHQTTLVAVSIPAAVFQTHQSTIRSPSVCKNLEPWAEGYLMKLCISTGSCNAIVCVCHGRRMIQ